MGIEPVSGDGGALRNFRYTEHITVGSAEAILDDDRMQSVVRDRVEAEERIALATEIGGDAGKIGLGDRVVLVFSDEQKRLSVRLVGGVNQFDKGHLSINSPLGQAIVGAEEGDEVEVPLENGRQRRVLVESVDKSSASAQMGQEQLAVIASA